MYTQYNNENVLQIKYNWDEYEWIYEINEKNYSSTNCVTTVKKIVF